MKIDSSSGARFALSIALACAVAAASSPGARAVDAYPERIAWIHDDADRAFALAKTENKPVFLYWGAVWCPPCNQVKATIFDRPEFIERSRAFVPVYLDGDSPHGQRLGGRFQVRGYPTMILFKPDGTEITRLPGEVDAQKYMQVLALGMNATRSAKDTLANALAPSPKLTAADWRLLAFYSWEVGDQRLMAHDQLASTLQKLAAACPPSVSDARVRLALKAMAALADAKPAMRPKFDARAARALAREVLADSQRTREQFDIVANSGAEIVGLLTQPKSEARAQLAGAWDEALARLVMDATLSDTDRLSALAARVQLARLDRPAGARLPEPLLTRVREEVARADRASTTPEARQTVINAAAYALGEAGLLDESDALLTAELARSRSPYYFMSDLAANAKKRGDTAAALDWYEKAYAASVGPATRLQWGAGYVGALLELAPSDETRIERVTSQLVDELAPAPSTFAGRNIDVLKRLGTRFSTWNVQGRHDAAFKRIQGRFDALCAKLPSDDPSRAVCARAFFPRASATTRT